MTLFVASPSHADWLDDQLAQLAQEFSVLRPQKAHVGIIADIDAQRLINAHHWVEANQQTPEAPWEFYGDVTYRSWSDAAAWIEQKNADGLPLSLELYDVIEKRVMKNHYYAGFERRRIKDAFAKGKLSSKQLADLLDRIDSGERVNFSGVDHGSLPAQFRQDPIDEFVHNGDLFLPDGTRYMTGTELRAIRKNRLLTVVESSIKKIGRGKYTGDVLYPRIKDLPGLVAEAIEDAQKKIDRSKSLKAKLKAIVELQVDLNTIHRSLDGNGRTIRLLSDLLYQRVGLPPPLYPNEFDITGNKMDVVRSTVEAMTRYLAAVQARLQNVNSPRLLFHWTSQGSLEWMVKNNPNPGKVPMQTIARDPWLVHGHPGLANRWGTFAWTSPVGGLVGGRDEAGDEVYAKTGNEGEPPRLLSMQVVSNPRVLRLNTVVDLPWYPETSIDYSQYDLIYHQGLGYDRVPIYREWVILNPDVIQRFTDRPGWMRKDLEVEVDKLRNPNYKIPDSQIHYLSRQQSEKRVRKILERFLTLKDDEGTEAPSRSLEKPRSQRARRSCSDELRN